MRARARLRSFARPISIVSASHMRIHVYEGGTSTPCVYGGGSTRVSARWTARRLEAPWMWRRSSPLANSTTWTWPRCRIGTHMPCMRAYARVRVYACAQCRLLHRRNCWLRSAGCEEKRTATHHPLIATSTPSRAIRARESASQSRVFWPI